MDKLRERRLIKHIARLQMSIQCKEKMIMNSLRGPQKMKDLVRAIMILRIRHEKAINTLRQRIRQ